MSTTRGGSPIALVCEAAKIKGSATLISLIFYAVGQTGCDVGHEKMFVKKKADLKMGPPEGVKRFSAFGELGCDFQLRIVRRQTS